MKAKTAHKPPQEAISESKPRFKPLSEIQRGALDLQWFASKHDHPMIEKAIGIAFVIKWAGRINARFFHNEKTSLPTNWCALGTCVGRDPNGFTRYNPHRANRTPDQNERDQKRPRTPLRYAISVALRVCDTDLSPPVDVLLSGAVSTLLHLVSNEELPRAGLNFDLFARYAWAIWTANREHSAMIELDVLRGLVGDGDDLDSSHGEIVAVCEALGLALKQLNLS